MAKVKINFSALWALNESAGAEQIALPNAASQVQGVAASPSIGDYDGDGAITDQDAAELENAKAKVNAIVSDPAIAASAAMSLATAANQANEYAASTAQNGQMAAARQA